MVTSSHDGAQLARRFDRTAFARRSDRHDHGGYGDVRGSWNAGCGIALQPALGFASGRCVGGAHLVAFVRLVVVIIIIAVIIVVFVVVIVVIVVIIVVFVIVIAIVVIFFRRVVVRYVVGSGDLLFVNLANAARWSHRRSLGA